MSADCCLPLPARRLYLQLQRLYRAQADKDVAAVEGHVRATLSSIGRPADSISRDTIKHFCKNARNLRVIRWGAARAAASRGAGRIATAS